VAAFINDSTVTSTFGSIGVSAFEHSQINAVSAAASLARRCGCRRNGERGRRRGKQCHSHDDERLYRRLHHNHADDVNVTAESLSAAPELSDIIVGNATDFATKLDDAGTTDPDDADTTANEKNNDVAADNTFLAQLSGILTAHNAVNSGQLLSPSGPRAANGR